MVLRNPISYLPEKWRVYTLHYIAKFLGIQFHIGMWPYGSRKPTNYEKFSALTRGRNGERY